MRFLNPEAFYLSILIGILLLLYFLKLRRQRYQVSSLLFWREEVEDLKADTPFQRLKISRLLLLQLLFLALCISALAKPFIKNAFSAHGKVILIIDTSASMNSEDENPNRLEAAKSEAQKLIPTLKSEDQMSLIAAGNPPKVLCGFSANPTELYKSLKNISPTDGVSNYNLKDAIALGISNLRQYEGYEEGTEGTIVIFSDAASLTEDLRQLPTELTEPEAKIKFLIHNFGKRSYNLAITALDVKLSPDSKKYEALVQVRNFYPSEKSVDLSLHIGKNEDILDIKTLKLPPDASSQAHFVLDNLGYKMTPLKLKLDVDDDLKSDDAAYFILNEQKNLKILLVNAGIGNRFLKESLKVQKGIEVSEIDLIDLKEQAYQAYQAYDVVIFDSFVPKRVPQVNALFINPQRNLPFMPIISETPNPSVIQVNSSHPIMRFIDMSSLSNLKISKSLFYKMPSWGLSLVEAEKAPLIWAGENENRREAFITFDLKNSDFPLKIAFPILISNTLNWLSEMNQNSKVLNLTVGSPIKINVGNMGKGVQLNASTIELTDPAGKKEELKIQNEVAVSKETQTVGVYEARFKGKTIARFAVNLLNEMESNSKPDFTGSTSSTSSTSSTLTGSTDSTDSIHESRLSLSRIVQENAPAPAPNASPTVYKFLLTAALSILAAEWWIYNRMEDKR